MKTVYLTLTSLFFTSLLMGQITIGDEKDLEKKISLRLGKIWEKVYQALENGNLEIYNDGACKHIKNFDTSIYTTYHDQNFKLGFVSYFQVTNRKTTSNYKLISIAPLLFINSVGINYHIGYVKFKDLKRILRSNEAELLAFLARAFSHIRFKTNIWNFDRQRNEVMLETLSDSCTSTTSLQSVRNLSRLFYYRIGQSLCTIADSSNSITFYELRSNKPIQVLDSVRKEYLVVPDKYFKDQFYDSTFYSKYDFRTFENLYFKGNQGTLTCRTGEQISLRKEDFLNVIPAWCEDILNRFY